MRRGEIWLVNMEPAYDHEIRKIRPAVIVQTEQSLPKSSTTIVVPLTSQNTEKVYPIEVLVDPGRSGLVRPSKAICDQLKCVDRRRLLKRLGVLSSSAENALDQALKVTLDLY